ncbi:MAG TPA: VOC family protein [Blastocatellia bacterium]|jgi:predicted enzyme related to lactoylglutathione lyase
MEKVKGIGGVFIYANDAKALADWYGLHFGLKFQCYEPEKCYGLEFCYYDVIDLNRRTHTVFSIMTSKTALPAERREFMVNYRVDDLEKFLAQLQSRGICVEKREEYDYGLFAWITDPEGNRIELYQPLIEPSCEESKQDSNSDQSKGGNV